MILKNEENYFTRIIDKNSIKSFIQVLKNTHWHAGSTWLRWFRTILYKALYEDLYGNVQWIVPVKKDDIQRNYQEKRKTMDI